MNGTGWHQEETQAPVKLTGSSSHTIIVTIPVPKAEPNLQSSTLFPKTNNPEGEDVSSFYSFGAVSAFK